MNSAKVVKDQLSVAQPHLSNFWTLVTKHNDHGYWIFVTQPASFELNIMKFLQTQYPMQAGFLREYLKNTVPRAIISLNCFKIIAFRERKPLACLRCFYTQYKSYNNKNYLNTTYELLYNATKTMPGGAIDHDYPLAFNMDLKNTSRN